VMLFRMSARVTATVVYCILMQILCVVSQKSFSKWAKLKKVGIDLHTFWTEGG